MILPSSTETPPLHHQFQLPVPVAQIATHIVSQMISTSRMGSSIEQLNMDNRSLPNQEATAMSPSLQKLSEMGEKLSSP